MRRLLGIVLVAAAGCATAFTAMESPEIDIINIMPLAAEGMFEQRMQVDLRIRNPNDFDLRVTGLSLQMDINDSPFARGLGNNPVTVPRLGEAKTSVVVTTSVLDLFRQVMALDKGLKYAIKGKLFLDHARIRSVPFEHAADLRQVGN